MFYRIYLPVLRCCLLESYFNLYKSLPWVISKHSHYNILKMSFSSKSVSGEMCEKESVFPPIYVLSRIERLSLTIKSLSDHICSGLVIKDIDIPENSDILSPSSIKQLVDAQVVIIDPKILAFNYKSIPRLQWAHCTWAGVEPMFEIMSEKPQFIVTRHGAEEFSEQIAEYVMGQVLILEKNLRDIWAAQVKMSWPEMQKCIGDCMSNRRLREITVGVLGVGNMGQAIAQFFKPHGTSVIGLCRRIRKPNEFGFFDKIESSLANVLAISDYIVNTLPSTPETVGLLNGDVLKACKKMPVFINVGRGNIINEETLLEALENNWLSHVSLDVFQKEPLPTNSKLWNSSQVTITPHCAAISLPKHVANDFLSSLLCYQQKSRMRNIVDWEKGY